MKTKNLIKNVGALSLSSYLLLSSFTGVTPASAATSFSDTIDVKKIATYSTGLTDEDGGVAEIVKYNADNKKFYVINGKLQTIDIVDLSSLQSGTTQELTKEKSINIADAVNSDTFQYGDLTSIDINTKNKIIAAAVQDADYTKNGRIVIMDYDGNILESFEAGVQPDNVEFTEDGKFILTANEAEPRLGLENGIDPNGSITIVNYETKTKSDVLFDDTSVIDSDVHIRNNGTLEDAVHDLEPEYISLTKDGKKAYVSLQENNAIASINVETGKVISVKSLGYKDHSLPQNALDAARNDKIELEQLPIRGVYMPDSIAVFEKNGVNYLLTANEGDATEWEEFVNIEDFKKVKENIQLDTSLFKGLTPEQAQATFERMKSSKDYDKLEVLTDRGNDAIYTLGGRSFTIWNADTMEQIYDSGSDFETITAERLPEVFNWSNDDDVFEKRSAKKGPEPEDIKIGTIGNDLYAFIGLERIGGVMTYNITNPSNATFANYINTRDFSSKVAGDVAPEGQDFISAENSPTGKPLLLVGNEVSGTVAINEYQVDPIVPIEIITLNQTSSTLEVGGTLQLTATITPDNTTDSTDLNWTSSNETVATVDANGVVTAIASGSATITAESADKKHKAESIITVTEKTVTEEDQKDETPVGEGDQTTDQPKGNNTDSDSTTKPVTTPEQTKNTTTTPNKEESKLNQTNSVSKNGNALPNTATSNYSLMLYGGVLLLIGGIVYYLNLRLRKQ